jgi:hypothetical protein
MSQLQVNRINDASGGVLAPISSVMRNRIINGAMVIDQRNAGASGTASGYTVDRWVFGATLTTKGTWQQDAGAVTPPAGFNDYLGFTSNSAYTPLTGDVFSFYQVIEGYNIADLGWGTANAKTVTVSFWVRSSLTGTFGGALSNTTRSNPFSFTINSANTWEYKTVTVAGDTSGTWGSTNNAGIFLFMTFGAGSSFQGTAGTWATADYRTVTGAVNTLGTNGATFYVTGVQLEEGSVATPFERRPYGTELALCQRYYQQIDYGHHNGGIAANWYQFNIGFPVVMRTDPTMTTSARGSNSGNAITLQDAGTVNGWTLDTVGTTHASIRGPNELLSRGHFGRGKFSAEL